MDKQNDNITGAKQRVKLSFFFCFLILSFLFLLFPPCTYAQNSPHVLEEQDKVYLILVDKMSLADISPSITPNLYNMVQEGALGLASSRTLRGQNIMDSCITIGAGNIARVYANGIIGCNSDETISGKNKTASDHYLHLTGYDPADSEVLLVNLPEIVIGLEAENVITIPGALGENLHLNNRKTAVLGNGDYENSALRAAVTIGMDAAGQVDFGDVGPSTLMPLPGRLLGQGTNYPYLMQKLTEIKPQADLIIIELSDLARLEKADSAFPYLADKEKILSLNLIDHMVGQILTLATQEQDLVLLLSPTPAQRQLSQKNKFLPVVAYGKGIASGFLSSGSTKRDFIIANTDIAPTILDFFGIKDELGAMIGIPMRITPFTGDKLMAAANISIDTSTATRLRSLLVKSYVVMQIVFILLAVAAIFWIKALRRVVEPLVVSLVTVPLVFLFLGKLPFTRDIYYFAAAAILIVLVTACFALLFKRRIFYAFVTISCLTLIALNTDILTGTTFIQSSVLGYDPMAGARYYGVGNEYMGIMLGSSIAVAAAFYERFPHKHVLFFLTAFFAFQCYVIGSPALGAQSDGIITAPAAYLFTLYLLSNIKMHWGYFAAACGVILAAAAGLLGYELHRPAEMQTHLGRTFSHILSGGWGQFWIIAARKVNMNITLIRYTIWSRVFLVMFAVLSLLVFRPVGALKQLLRSRTILVKGFLGIISGALIGLIINDSGIVATSTTCIYLVIPLLLLMLEMQHEETTEGQNQCKTNNIQE